MGRTVPSYRHVAERERNKWILPLNFKEFDTTKLPAPKTKS